MLTLKKTESRKIIEITNEMNNISVDRLEHIHPVWKDFILKLDEIPTPKRLELINEEERIKLSEWISTSAEAEHKLDPLDSLLEHKIYIISYISLQRKDFYTAYRHAECLPEYAPQEPCYRILLGMAAFGLGDYHKSVQQLDLAIYHAPEHPLGNAINGFIAAFTRDHVKALRCTKAALKEESKIRLWGGTRWLPLALFQSEHLLFGTSSAGGIESGMFQNVSPSAHMRKTSKILPKVIDFIDFLDDKKKDVLLISCDKNYFQKYAIPMALSLADSQSPLALHLHLINPDDESLELLKKIHKTLKEKLRATYERAEIGKICPELIYYLCARYCRLAEFKINSQHDYAMFDADMLINRPFSFSDMREQASTKADCIMLYVKDEPVWDCLLGGFCIFGKNSETILSSISDFILESMINGKGRWFLDEIALFLAAQNSQKESIGYISNYNFCDLEHKEDSFVWAITADKSAEKFIRRSQHLLEKYLA